MLSTVNCQGIAALSQNKIKGLKTPNADKELEQLELSPVTGGSTTTAHGPGKAVGQFLRKLNKYSTI